MRINGILKSRGAEVTQVHLRTNLFASTVGGVGVTSSWKSWLALSDEGCATHLQSSLTLFTWSPLGSVCFRLPMSTTSCLKEKPASSSSEVWKLPVTLHCLWPYGIHCFICSNWQIRWQPQVLVLNYHTQHHHDSPQPHAEKNYAIIYLHKCGLWHASCLPKMKWLEQKLIAFSAWKTLHRHHQTIWTFEFLLTK